MMEKTVAIEEAREFAERAKQLKAERAANAAGVHAGERVAPDASETTIGTARAADARQQTSERTSNNGYLYPPGRWFLRGGAAWGCLPPAPPAGT
jgi:hypothetical protein